VIGLIIYFRCRTPDRIILATKLNMIASLCYLALTAIASFANGAELEEKLSSALFGRPEVQKLLEQSWKSRRASVLPLPNSVRADILEIIGFSGTESSVMEREAPILFAAGMTTRRHEYIRSLGLEPNRAIEGEPGVTVTLIPHSSRTSYGQDTARGVTSSPPLYYEALRALNDSEATVLVQDVSSLWLSLAMVPRAIEGSAPYLTVSRCDLFLNPARSAGARSGSSSTISSSGGEGEGEGGYDSAEGPLDSPGAGAKAVFEPLRRGPEDASQPPQEAQALLATLGRPVGRASGLSMTSGKAGYSGGGGGGGGVAWGGLFFPSERRAVQASSSGSRGTRAPERQQQQQQQQLYRFSAEELLVLQLSPAPTRWQAWHAGQAVLPVHPDEASRLLLAAPRVGADGFVAENGISATLGAGAAMFVPRGHAFNVTSPEGRASSHLVCRLRTDLGSDLLHTALELLGAGADAADSDSWRVLRQELAPQRALLSRVALPATHLADACAPNSNSHRARDVKVTWLHLFHFFLAEAVLRLTRAEASAASESAGGDVNAHLPEADLRSLLRGELRVPSWGSRSGGPQSAGSEAAKREEEETHLAFHRKLLSLQRVASQLLTWTPENFAHAVVALQYAPEGLRFPGRVAAALEPVRQCLVEKRTRGGMPVLLPLFLPQGVFERTAEAVRQTFESNAGLQLLVEATHVMEKSRAAGSKKRAMRRLERASRVRKQVGLLAQL
jgi:hypothetical protein